MKTLGAVVRLLGHRCRAWLGFECLFQVLLICLAMPGIKLTVDGAMKIMGYAYLTWENVFTFIFSPLVLLFILLWMLLLTLAAVFNLAGLHYILAFDDAQDQPRVQDAIRYALHRLKHCFRVSNLTLVPYLLIFLPFVQVGTSAGVINTLEIPEFVMEYVQTNTVLGVAYIIVMLILTIVAFRFVFSTVYFVADEGLTFPQAARKGQEAGKHHFLLDMLRVILVPALTSALVGLLIFLPLLVVLMVSNELSMAVGLFSGFYAIAGIFVGSPVSYATCLTLLTQRDKTLEAPEPPALHMDAWIAPAVVAAVLVAAVAGGVYFVQDNVLGPASVAKQSGNNEVLLTAHRGGAFAAPENTMAAFKQAKLDGADVCEIDVQQSADGVIFVSHDSNFSRVSGVDKGAWELTWDQIRELDATGSYWENDFEKQSYPSLDEVISWAKDNNMQLNIELKPTGHETNFEKSVVDVVDAHDFASQCVMTSQVYDTVKRVKECNPNITCVYVMTLAYGEVWRMEAADAFSVEQLNATPALISALHKRGKEVYAWVVNTDASMERMVVNGVDNIISDDVPLAREVIDDTKTLTPLERFLNALAALLS